MQIRAVIVQILVFLFFGSAAAYAQKFDFESYPEMNVSFNHLDLELLLHDDGRIEGEAVYDVSLKTSLADTIRLDAVKMDIKRVLWDGNPADFVFDKDRLLIVKPEGIVPGEVHKLIVNYDANSTFGLHQTPDEGIWTSLLPRSTSHWLPVFDHPRVAFTSRMAITYPSGQSAIATGRGGEAEVVSVDSEREIFVTEQVVPASALAFAVGNFESFRTIEGLNQIHLHVSPKAQLNAEQRNRLFEAAVSALRSAEDKTSAGYPWRSLHLVILEDSYWEPKNYGAGVVFAYGNRGNLDEQIRYGVTSQWAGVYLREESWGDSEVVRLMQGWFPEQPSEIEKIPDENAGVYSGFSPEEQNVRRIFLNEDEQKALQEVLDLTVPVLFRDQPGVYNWHEFAIEAYRLTGRRLFESPQIKLEVSENEDKEESSNIRYFADYNWQESEGIVTINITADGEATDELVAASLTTAYFDDTQTREISFSGSAESLELNVNPTIEYMKITVPEESGITIEEKKPFMFWLNQLRRDDVEGRKEAAVGSRDYADNPDLQLALLDRLRAEENEEVKAEIIRSLSMVTAGASGTDQIFLQRYREDSPGVIKKALIEAFASYRGNEEVIGRLQQAVLRNQSIDLKKAAAESLSLVADTARFERITEQLISREEALPVAEKLLRTLAGMDREEEAVSMAGTFLGELNPWKLRQSALKLMLEFETSSSFWEERLPALLSDADPRIRYTAAEGLKYLPAESRNQLIESRLFEEFDGRVAKKLESIKEAS